MAKYIVKFDDHKIVFIDEKTGKNTVEGKGEKHVIEDPRKQAIFAFGSKHVVLVKGKEVDEKTYARFSKAAQKKYFTIDISADPKAIDEKKVIDKKK